MKSFFFAVLKLLLSLCLLFLTVGLLWTLYLLPLDLDKPNIVWPFLVGLAGGVVFFTLVSRVLFLYVFGHELTHWFVAKLFLRKTDGMRVESRGGSVAVQQPNIWIILAPYFVPFYSLLWILIYGVFRFGYGAPAPPTMSKIFYAGLGITYAFHVVCTIHSLLREQSDVQLHGYFLSMSLVICTNVLLVACALLSITGQWQEGWTVLWRRLGLEWGGIGLVGGWLYERLADLGDWVCGFF